MKKYITFYCFIFIFIRNYAQEYRNKDFIGYVNYMNISLVNVRPQYLLPFNYPEDTDWVSRDKIKKVSYIINDKVSQTSHYLEDGRIRDITFGDGTKSIFSQNKNEIISKTYKSNNEEFSVMTKRMNSGGYLESIKNQYTGSKDSTMKKIYYANDRIIKTEEYHNNKVQSKYEFFFNKGLLTKYTHTNLAIAIQPNRTRESENILYHYDKNNNCISVERTYYFGELKSNHYFTYDADNHLIHEKYIIDQNSNMKSQEGTLEYSYDHKDRIVKITEVKNSKKSVAEITYGDNGKVKTIIVTGDRGSESSYFPTSFYFENLKNVFGFKYDQKGNLVEYMKIINGELNNKIQYDIEYY